jgi:hypothetical protein
MNNRRLIINLAGTLENVDLAEVAIQAAVTDLHKNTGVGINCNRYDPTSMRWEMLPTSDQGTQRLRVVGGWLVMTETIWYNLDGEGSQRNEQHQLVMCFVPDPTHDWLR